MAVRDLIAPILAKGWVTVPGAYDPALMAEIKQAMVDVYPLYRRLHAKKGLFSAAEYALHHLPVLCPAVLRLLERNPIADQLTWYFGGKYILNTLGGAIIPPGAEIYTRRIHRDIRTFSGAGHLMVNTLVMLDDCTEENGATWMMSGSHLTADQPSEAEFYDTAERATGRAGDVLIFDANLWHAAGQNHSQATRHILTPIYTKPFLKQQLDYPAALGVDRGLVLSDELRQVLGYQARTPVSLLDFYQQPEDRWYQSDQG
jgi:hypothetical protein